MNLRRFLGAAAEWIHHVAAISLTVKMGGPELTALYLVAYVLPRYLIEPPRWLWILSPIGFVSIALLPASTPLVVSAALVAGIGRAAAGRPSAWLAGLEKVSGVPAVLGAATGAALLSSSDPAGFIGAAVVCVFAYNDGPSRVGASGPLMPSVVAAAIVIGMRVLEPVLLLDPAAGAVFAIAWAAGAGLGARWSSRADLRAVAAAPFVGAAAIALMGTVEGPGMLFLWSGVAMSTALITSAAARSAGRLRAIAPVIVVCASAFAAAAGFFERLPSALWFGATVLLVGGFVSLGVLARGARAEPKAVEAEPVIPPEPATILLDQDIVEEPETEDALVMAATELLDALKTARSIRADALDTLWMSMDPFHDLKGKTSDALDELSAAVSRARDRLAQTGS